MSDPCLRRAYGNSRVRQTFGQISKRMFSRAKIAVLKLHEFAESRISRIVNKTNRPLESIRKRPEGSKPREREGENFFFLFSLLPLRNNIERGLLQTKGTTRYSKGVKVPRNEGTMSNLARTPDPKGWTSLLGFVLREVNSLGRCF